MRSEKRQGNYCITWAKGTALIAVKTLNWGISHEIDKGQGVKGLEIDLFLDNHSIGHTEVS